MIQLFAVGSSSLETWPLETKCPKITSGNGSDRIFSCESYFTGGEHHCSGEASHCAVFKSIHSFILNEPRQLLSVGDVKTVDYASMVLHTCLDEAKVEELSQAQNIQLALRVMELCRTHRDLEWM